MLQSTGLQRLDTAQCLNNRRGKEKDGCAEPASGKVTVMGAAVTVSCFYHRCEVVQGVSRTPKLKSMKSACG